MLDVNVADFSYNSTDFNKPHRLKERDSRLTHFSAHEILNNFAPIPLNCRDPHFGIFWGLKLFLGYLATSNAKPDVGFLLGDTDFL